MPKLRPPEPPHADLEALLHQLEGEFPGFRIVPKRESRLNWLIDKLLKAITLGGQRTYLSRYHTVIGSTLYVPATWDEMSAVDKVILLRHERIHLLQRRRLTFLGLAFVYLVPWLPLGLAYGRAKLEWEAYTETLRATAELKGLEAAEASDLREHIIARFTGPDYGWMWPFPRQLNAWYDAVLQELRSSAG